MPAYRVFVGNCPFSTPLRPLASDAFSHWKPRPQHSPWSAACPGVLGSLQALECIKYLTGLGRLLKNRILLWDGDSMEFHVDDVQKDPGAPCAGIRESEVRR